MLKVIRLAVQILKVNLKLMNGEIVKNISNINHSAQTSYWGVVIVTLFLIFCSCNIFSQTLFYSDIFHGGITGNGATRGAGSGTITMNVQIPPISTIKKAFLIA